MGLLRRVRPPACAALSLALVLVACGRDPGRTGLGDKGTGGANGTGGTVGSGGAAGGLSGSGGANGFVPPPGGDAPPGPPTYDLTLHGQGPCSGSSLEQTIAAVHKEWPELADIKVLHTNDPNRVGDGSFIYAFALESGFALVFKRGGGDCPAGCTDNEYWYFATDAACAPLQVGHFKAAWGTGACLATSGTALWGLPRAPDPAVVCGADNSPTDISGVYSLTGVGTRLACTEKAAAEPQMSVTVSLTLTVAQSVGDLAHGTVTVQGTGHPLIDGHPIAATFTRRRFAALSEVSNLPATCINQHTTRIDLDLESGTPGRLQFMETRSLDCPPSQNYCKGQLDLQLDP